MLRSIFYRIILIRARFSSRFSRLVCGATITIRADRDKVKSEKFGKRDLTGSMISADGTADREEEPCSPGIQE